MLITFVWLVALALFGVSGVLTIVWLVKNQIAGSVISAIVGFSAFIVLLAMACTLSPVTTPFQPQVLVVGGGATLLKLFAYHVTYGQNAHGRLRSVSVREECDHDSLLELQKPFLRALTPRPGFVPEQLSTPPVLTELSGHTIIRVSGKINHYSGDMFWSDCHKAVQNGAKSVLVEVCTPGGNTNVASSMYDRLRQLAQQVDVTVLITGECMSVGIPFVLAVDVSHRWATKNTQFLIHATNWYESDGTVVPKVQMSLPMSNVNDVKNEWLIATILDGSAVERNGLKTLIASKEDFYFDAPTAHKLGLIKGII